MKVITIRIDELLEKELDNFLKETKINKSMFIRTCIIEKLAKIQATNNK